MYSSRDSSPLGSIITSLIISSPGIANSQGGSGSLPAIIPATVPASSPAIAPASLPDSDPASSPAIPPAIMPAISEPIQSSSNLAPLEHRAGELGKVLIS